MSVSHHGLCYPDGLLDTLEVIQPRPPPHEPIRIIDSRSFAALHLHHLTKHAPDSVLFPFLHGLEGSNQAQNLFFSHGTPPGGHLKPAKVPSYRGLIWVVCDKDIDPDIPMAETQSLDSDDDDDDDDDDDLDEECFSDGSSYLIDPDSFAMDVDQIDLHLHQSSFECPGADDPDNGPPHMHPISHRAVHAPSKAPIPTVNTALPASLHSHERRDSTASSTFSTSTENDSCRTDSSPVSSTLSTPPTSIASSPSPDKSVARQPLTFSPPISSSSPAPPPLRKGPPILTSTFYIKDLLQTNSDGEPEFLPPKVPEGISLRNFGIQVPIYATLSDIVVYSPKGITSNSVVLAEKFKIAIEKKLAERRARLRSSIQDSGEAASGPAHEPDGLLAYNVFVLSATYEKLCEVVPNLIVLPSDSDPRPNTVDFAEREKKEMRELTRASEIISVSPPGVEQEHPRPANPPWDPTIGQVFLGNANDVPLAQGSGMSSPSSSAYMSSSHTSSIGDLYDENSSLDPNDPFNYSSNDPVQGLGYDICVECHEFAPCPSAVHFRAAEEHFRMLDVAWAQRCRSNPAMGDGAPIPPRPPPNANAVIHFPFPSSPPSNTATVNTLLPAIRFFERMLQPPTSQVHEFAEPERVKTSPPGTRRWSSASILPKTPPTPLSASCPPTTSLHGSSAATDTPPSRPLKILLYSSDGYTESSVPALCLLMAVRRLSLPEAYLELQVAKRRSFFVYQADLGVLRRVEARLAGERAPGTSGTVMTSIPNGTGGRVAGGKYVSGWGGFTFHGTGLQSASNGNGNTSSGSIRNQGQHPYRRPAANSVSSPHAPTVVIPQSRMITPSPGHAVRSRPRASTSPWLPSLFSDHQAWFNDPRFDGSFPSRVLPFLYLGNLNHASNVYMLHALGVTHVVSVGECALIPPPHVAGAACSAGPVASHRGVGGSPVAGKGEPGNEGSLWVEAREGRIKVLDIKGVCDDGIDTLEPQLGPICDWIERARLEGGQVLVHCRVGVSRSATVTIAYVMKHLGLPLVDAYLIVRSRRLSVLIQPNMRLLYNLCGWEVKLAQERAGGDEQRLREELAGALSWPYLAKEVHSLNEKYLH